MIIIRNSQTLCRAYSLFGMLCLLTAFFASPTFASELYTDVNFTASDEFGGILNSGLAVQLKNCDVTRVMVLKPHDSAETRFIARLFYERAPKITRCAMEVGSRGFISSSSYDLGNALSESTVTVQMPIQLKHALTVQVSRDAQTLSGLDVFFNGMSPRYFRDGIYYLAGYGEGLLEISHPGYSPLVSDELKKPISLNSSSVFSVVLAGSGSCLKTTVSLSCKSPTPLVAFDIDSESGSTLFDGEIVVYTNQSRTQIAHVVEGNIIHVASRFIDENVEYMALLPGTYYVKIKKIGYNDAYATIEVREGIPFSKAIVVQLESANRVSPQRSKVMVSKSQAIANGIDTISVTAEILGSDASRLRYIPVEISTGNITDIIVYPEGKLTGANGSVTAYITTKNPGNRVITVNSQGNLLATFMVVNFSSSSSSAVDVHVSSVSMTPSPIRADGKEFVSFGITARDGLGSILSGKKIKVTSNRNSADIISCGSLVTDAQGVAICTFSSTSPGFPLLSFEIDGVVVDVLVVSVSPQT